VGIKADLLNDTLRVNAAAFWNNYDDIQIVLQAGISPLNANAGDARIRGIELEAEYYPLENLSFVGSFGYTDAEYRSISDLVAPQVTIDDDLQNTPEFNFSAATNYVQPLQGYGSLGFNLNYSWTSETANDAQNTPELIQDAVGQLGGQIKYEPEEGNWAISIIGRNITNERIIGAGFNSGGLSFVEASFNRPGEWRLKFDYDF
jgi:iron complex outermembrane receptor protein